MKPEEIEVGSRLRIRGSQKIATALTNTFDDDGDCCVVIKYDKEAFIYPVDAMEPAPKPMYRPISKHGWRDHKVSPHSELEGWLVKDTPDSTPRFEPAE